MQHVFYLLILISDKYVCEQSKYIHVLSVDSTITQLALIVYRPVEGELKFASRRCAYQVLAEPASVKSYPKGLTLWPW
jgi:hypothetical protein